MDETKALTCKICNKAGLVKIGIHVRRKHQLSMKAYETWVPSEAETKVNLKPMVPEITSKTVLAFFKEMFNKVRSSRLWAALR